MSRSIGERTSNVPVAVAPGAVDQVLVVRPEPGLDAGHGLFEAGVQLLVVGAERRVGDLDARLGVGRHVQDPSSRGRARGAGGVVAVSLARRRLRPATRRWRPAGGPPRSASRPPRRRPVRACRDRTKIPRRPARCAARMSVRTSSPTIAISDRAASRSPRPRAAAPATACPEARPRWLAERSARLARSRTRARRRTRRRPAVGPSGVSHHGLRCIPISSAPPRTSRNARLRLS